MTRSVRSGFGSSIALLEAGVHERGVVRRRAAIRHTARNNDNDLYSCTIYTLLYN